MIVQRFLKWKDHADASKRAAAASALGRAYLQSEMDIDERCAAEAALTLMLDDPSPRVRYAIAEAMASSPATPDQIATSLLQDQFDIAALIVARSPVLRDADLSERVRYGDQRLQTLIASRPEVSAHLASTLAECGEEKAVAALARNANARLDFAAREVIVTRFGDRADVRGAMLARRELEPVLRLRLLAHAAESMSKNGLVAKVLGSGSAERLSENARQKALVELLNPMSDTDFDRIVEELRQRGELDSVLLIRSLCRGRIDFLAQVFANLSGMSTERVTSILVSERQTQFRALLGSCGIAKSLHELFLNGIALWRDVAQGRLVAGPQEVTRILMENVQSRAQVDVASANDDLIALLRSIYLDAVRHNARIHAQHLAVAAA